MSSLSLALFYGNNLSTQILASQLGSRLHALGHRICFVHSRRSTSAKYQAERHWPEVYFMVVLLEEVIFPFLDARELLPTAKAWSPRHLAEQCGAPLLRVSHTELHGPESLTFLKAHAVQGGLALRFPFVFKEPYFAYFQREKETSESAFFWNLHSAMLPEYAGYAPFRWAMFNREAFASMTLQEMSLELDAGAILAMRPQPINYELDMVSALLELIPGAVEMTLAAVEQRAKGQASVPDVGRGGGEGRYYPRLRAEDRERMLAQGMRFVDLDRLKAVYLDQFSVPGTAHYAAFKALLDQHLVPTKNP